MNAITSYLDTLAKRFGQAWNQFWFAASDPLSTCVLRIVVGAAGLWWLVTYSFDLQTLLGPEGWLSVEGLKQWRGQRGFSLLDYVGSTSGLWIVHAAAVASMAMFALGLWTRVTSILATVFFLSYVWRAPMLGGELEDILAMLMVYLCIAPCGAQLSLDRWLARRRGAAMPVAASSLATISTRLMQVHISAIYFMMALAKVRGAVWWTGEAVWWMAARPESRLVDLTWLKNYPDVVAVWTHGIVIFEFAFAILIWNRAARPLLLALSVVTWLGLALLTGSLGFCLLMLAANLAFVPAAALRQCCSCGVEKSQAAVVEPPRSSRQPLTAGAR